jgi:hypothetical protein
MALISTRTHAVGDYAGGVLMIAAAKLPFVRDRRAAALLRAAGASTLVASALTDYELGLWRRLPMRVHLALDGVGGAVMAGSAALLRGSGAGAGSWVPHAAIGLGQLAGAALTDRGPSASDATGIPATPTHLSGEGLAPSGDELVAQQEAAAAAEAASIGGSVPSETGDPAMAPVYEAGGGEAEGFEIAEADLVENASHGGGHGDPARDAIAPELEADNSTAVYGEADHEPTAADDPRTSDEEAAQGPGAAA